jgi:isocitrate/isopropylmalate dehydrogenase
VQTIVVLEGDQTGQELLEEALRVLQPDVIGVELGFVRFDLSLEGRRSTRKWRRSRGAGAIREHWVRPEGSDRDAGRRRRRRLAQPDPPRGDRRQGDRANRAQDPGRRTPRRRPRPHLRRPDGRRGRVRAKEWREGEGDDEVAFRTERIERRICHAVAEFAFRQAERTGAKVFGGPKYTVSPIYEGMLKEEMDAAAARHPEVPYEPQLIDATFALLISSSGAPMVIPALNRDGDILSDLVLPLFGSIAGSESLLVAFGDDYVPSALMAEAAHGTAPALQGKDVANPMAMILAGAALLSHAEDGEAQTCGRAIREACLEAVADGIRTADLGGHAGTTEFTDEVIRRTRTKVEVWSSL